MQGFDTHSWASHFFDVRGSVVRGIALRVLVAGAWAALIVLIHKRWVSMAFPLTLHTLVGVALSLLLVFRTNSSYDRFWEGRKAWGGIVNTTRNLTRALSAWLPHRPDLVRQGILWTVCFPYATMHSLRGERGLGAKAALLPRETAQAVEQAQHVPFAVSLMISDTIARARRAGDLPDILAAELDENVQLLIDHLGVCERIHKTPLPFAYVVHLRRALVLYAGSLPFALLEPFQWFAVPATLVVTFIFFGIEAIGVEIEDPFGGDDNDLPLERICETIEGNLMAILPAAEAPGQPVDA